MGRVIEKTIHCGTSGNRYKAYFEEKQPGEWYGTATEKLPQPSFFERLSQKSKTKKSGESFLAKLGLLSSGGKETANADDLSKKVDVQGAFYTGEHTCPFCGNTGFVQCGACGEWTCLKENATRFKCGGCGNEGEITGQIESTSGDLTSDDCNPHSTNNGYTLK